MRTPIHCPICKEPLLNDFRERNTKEEYLIKRCKKKPSHNFSCLVDRDEIQDAAFVESANWNARRTVFFNFSNHIIRLITADNGDIKTTYLPYFEPDLDNYSKMMERIEMLLAFS